MGFGWFWSNFSFKRSLGGLPVLIHTHAEDHSPKLQPTSRLGRAAPATRNQPLRPPEEETSCVPKEDTTCSVEASSVEPSGVDQVVVLQAT